MPAGIPIMPRSRHEAIVPKNIIPAKHNVKRRKVIIVYHQKRNDVAFKKASGKECPNPKLRQNQIKDTITQTIHFPFKALPLLYKLTRNCQFSGKNKKGAGV